MKKLTSQFRGIVYRHVKTGRDYGIIGLGRRTSSPSEDVVIYSQVQANQIDYTRLWVRDLDEFLSKDETTKQPRFKRIRTQR